MQNPVRGCTRRCQSLLLVLTNNVPMNSQYITVHDTIATSEWLDIRIITTYLRSLTQELTPPDAVQWVTWSYEIVDGKRMKVPMVINGRSKKKNNDLSKRVTFAEAIDALSPSNGSRYNGLGIVFTETRMLLGIRLNHCILNAAVPPEIAALVKMARTYTEVSPSRTDLHMIFKLTSPLKLGRNESSDYECYTENQWFPYTGMKWFESYPVRTLTPEEALGILQMPDHPWGGVIQLFLPQWQYATLLDVGNK